MWFKTNKPTKKQNSQHHERRFSEEWVSLSLKTPPFFWPPSYDVDPHSKLSKILLFSEAAYNYERIGDYSGHIAKFVINEKTAVDDELLDILKKMHKYAQKSISYATDAFINGNIDSRGNLMDTEEKIHETQQKAMNLIANQMVETSFEDIEMSNYYIYISRVVKSFERMGDISVEIMDLAAEFHKDIPRPTTPRSFREKI